MAASTSLRLLDVRNCELGAEGVAVLADAVARCPSLRELNVSGNSMGVAGAQALADALAQDGVQSFQLHPRLCVVIDPVQERTLIPPPTRAKRVGRSAA